MSLPREYYETLVAGMPDAVVGVDRSLRVILWNPAAEELMERSARRVQGRFLEELLGGGSRLVHLLAETVRTGESHSDGDSQIVKPDGRTVGVSVAASPLPGPTGELAGAVAVVRDLSRVKQLEEEVRRGERLAAVGSMALGIAHEIRNPLGAIRGAAQLLRHEVRSAGTEYAEVMIKEIDRMSRVMEALMDLGRPMSFTFRLVNLHQILDQVVLLKESQVQGVRLLRRYDPSLPPILADEDRLMQVFHNLIGNALEAMAGGGVLTLTTRISTNPLFSKVDVGRGAAPMVEILVGDTGPGIPKELCARIFDPFVTTKPKGLGLGLAICHRIVEEHRGSIQVESQVGKGTTFALYLPIQR